MASVDEVGGADEKCDVCGHGWVERVSEEVPDFFVAGESIQYPGCCEDYEYCGQCISSLVCEVS